MKTWLVSVEVLYADLPVAGPSQAANANAKTDHRSLEDGTADHPVDVDASPPPMKKSRKSDGSAVATSSNARSGKKDSIRLYEGKKFALKFVFEDGYPIEAPQVTFVDTVVDGYHYRVPVHPHIYSNGHICASILADGWSPVLNAASIALTMQSMLASNHKYEL